MTSVQEQHKFKRQIITNQLIFIYHNFVFSIGINAQINGILFFVILC